MSHTPDDPLTHLEMQKLYNDWKSIVWVVRVQFEEEGSFFQTIATACSVSRDGLILTCFHSIPKTSYTIDVRRLDEDNFQAVKVVYEMPNWDVLLLQLVDRNGCKYARLTRDCSLTVGQTVLHIGNPDNCVGSLLVGEVAFECIDNVEIPVGHATCKNYTFTSITTTPKYRIMGHSLNERAICSSDCERSSLENLHPLLPIIQINGLFVQQGCSGGPVFNVRGEIVGMFILTSHGFSIAIHVAVLREVLKLFQKYGENTSDPKVQVGTSKKFKAPYRKGKGRRK